MDDYQIAQWKHDQHAAWYARQSIDAESLQRSRAAESRAIAQWEESRAYQERNELRASRMEQHTIEQARLAREYQERSEYRQIESHRWQRESHAIHMQREAERQEHERNARHLVAQRFSNPKASGVLGNARFATVEDARAMGLCNSAGLFLGVLNGKGLFYGGQSHLTTYAKNRAGKGSTLLIPNLAHHSCTGQRSVVVVDAKNGETTYATAYHRHKNFGSKVITLNPRGLAGMQRHRLNPLEGIVRAVPADMFDEAAIASHVLVPPRAGDKDPWVKQGARAALQTVLAHMAFSSPATCTLGNLWTFFVRGDQAIFDDFKAMAKSDLPEVRHFAGRIASLMFAKNQWSAYAAELMDALAPFSPSSPYTWATDASDLDPRELTRDPHTVSLMLPGRDLESKGRWVSLVLNYLIETTAANPGPVQPLFMLDEFTQMPPIPGVLKALNLYSGLGVQFWFFAQDPKAVADLYGEEGARRIEAQSAVVQAFRINDQDLMKSFEYLSGRTSVPVISANMSDGGQLGTGLTLSEQTRTLLQPEDMRNMGPDEQLIRLEFGPIVRADLVPWWDQATTDELGRPGPMLTKLLGDPRDVLLGIPAPKHWDDGDTTAVIESEASTLPAIPSDLAPPDQE